MLSKIKFTKMTCFTFLTLITIMFSFTVKLSAEDLNLTYKDHTKVMEFTLQHQSDIVKWMKNRNIRKKPSNNEILQFLAKISNTRTTYDIHLAIVESININNKNRSKRLKRELNQRVNSIISKVKMAKSIQKLKSLLSNEITKTRGENDSLAVGIKIAQQILQDGIQHNIYSVNTLKKYSPTKGFWSDAYHHAKDSIVGHLKDDVKGAIIGGVIGGGIPGAIGGAIKESTGSVGGAIWDMLTHPTPAY